MFRAPPKNTPSGNVLRRPSAKIAAAAAAVAALALLGVAPPPPCRAAPPAATDFSAGAGQRVTDLKLPLHRHENGRVKELFLAREASIDDAGRFVVDGGMTLLTLDAAGGTSGVARAVSGWYDGGSGLAECQGPVSLDLPPRGVSLSGTNMTWNGSVSVARIETNALLSIRRGDEGGAPRGILPPRSEAGKSADRPKTDILPRRVREGADANAPSTIASDSLEFDYANMVAVFDGHALVTDPEFTLRADRMVVLFEGSNDVRRIDCIGRVEAEGADDVRIRCGQASYTRENGLVLLSNDPVVTHQGRTVRGETLSLWLGDERIVARPSARIDLPAGSLPRKKIPSAGGSKGTSAKRSGGFGGTPVAITAASMEFFYKLGTGLLEGDVTVADPEFRLRTDKALVFLDENRKLRRIDCDGDVRAKGRDMTASGGHATYSAADETLALTLDPVATQAGNSIRGDELLVRLADETAEARGHALATAHPDSFRGRRDRPAGTPASTLTAETIRYDRQARRIEARGGVTAVDPEATLKAKRADAFLSETNELLRIEAEGAVDIQVADPEPEKGAGDIFATSERAVYDRATSTATLTGDPLVRRGVQAVRGEPLFVDFVKMSVSAKGFAGSGELPNKTP